MSWATQAQINHELDGLGLTRIRETIKACGQRAQWSYPAVILAIMSRETWMTNIVGDMGHGRGCMQIDDRTWGAWLASQDGVMSGTWKPVTGRAVESMHAPTLVAAVGKAVAILHDNWNSTASVPNHERARTMIAGYNCGPGNALAGYTRHGNPDYYTTGANYSADVMGRETMVHRYLKERNLVP